MLGGVGCGERLNASPEERIFFLTIVAFDLGKGGDTFRARDEDSQVYKLMNKDIDDDERQDEGEAELPHVTSWLQVCSSF